MSKNNVIANAGQSRRNLLVGGLAVAASAGAAAATHAGNAAGMKASHTAAHRTNMVTTQDGTQIYYKDWGTGPNTVVFSHGWPLSADAWEDQMMFLASNGYRCIAHDRRGHGRSSQPWDGNNYDTFAADLNTLVTALDVKNATFVGHSMGGGEVARYLGKFGSARFQGSADCCGDAADAQNRQEPRRHAHRCF